MKHHGNGNVPRNTSKTKLTLYYSYIVDLEACEDWRNDPGRLEFREHLFIWWDLVRRDNKTDALVW